MDALSPRVLSASNTTRIFASWLLAASALGLGVWGCTDADAGEPARVDPNDEGQQDAASPRGRRDARLEATHLEATHLKATHLEATHLEAIGGYAAKRGIIGAEIVSYDPPSARLFVTNSSLPVVDVLDLSDPSAPTPIAQIDLSAYGAAPTSVDIADGVLAVAIPASAKQAPGTVLFVRAADLSQLAAIPVGPLPDMLSFSPDHTRLVVACEGEPTLDHRLDPTGSIAVIDLGADFAALGDADVHYAGFDAFDLGTLAPGIRVRSDTTISQDLEPEFIAISSDSKTAWVSLQENNALAIVDLDSATVTDLVSFGEVPHPRLSELPHFAALPIFAMRQPDALAHFRADDRNYVISANEGECRSDERAAILELSLDPVAFPDAAALQADDALGRAIVSRLEGDLDHDGDHDELHGCGSRSISIWTAEGSLVWDSGALFERLFDAPANEVGLDEGAAPEGVITAELWGRPYAFVALERAGGVAVFDLSVPSAPEFLFHADVEGDLGPEGLELILPEHSPIGAPLLVVANEVSDSVRVYRVVGG